MSLPLAGFTTSIEYLYLCKSLYSPAHVETVVSVLEGRGTMCVFKTINTVSFAIQDLSQRLLNLLQPRLFALAAVSSLLYLHSLSFIGNPGIYYP